MERSTGDDELTSFGIINGGTVEILLPVSFIVVRAVYVRTVVTFRFIEVFPVK